MKLPRIFVGHQSRHIDEIEHYKLVSKACSHKLTTQELLDFTSSSSIQYFKSAIQANASRYKRDCFKKVSEIYEKLKLKEDQCPSKNRLCQKIKLAQTRALEEWNSIEELYELDAKKKEEKRLEEIRKNEGKSLGYNGYFDNEIGIKDQVSHFIKNFEKPQSNGAGSYCNNSLSRAVKTQSGKNNSLFGYDEVISELMPLISQTLSPKCIQDFVQGYVSYKIRSSREEKPLCEQEECVKTRQKKKLFHDNVSHLLGFVSNDKGVKYFCEQLGHIPKSNPGAFFRDFWKEIDQVNSCTELEIGDSKHERNYRLTRLSEKNFKATIALKFTHSDPNRNKEMFEKTQQCLANASQYFSSRGKNIKVEIISTEENNSLPANMKTNPYEIGIDNNPKARANSRKYPVGVGCATITHEVLHILGLADEYHETEREVFYNEKTKEAYRELPSTKNPANYKKKFAYNDCRSMAKSLSIMSESYNSYHHIVRQRVSCKCETQYCRDSFKDPKKAQLLLTRTWPKDAFIYLSESKIDHRLYCTHSFIDTKPIKATKLPEAPQEIMESTKNKLVFRGYQMYLHSDKKPGASLSSRRWTCKCEDGDQKCLKLIKDKKETIENKDFYNTGFCPGNTKATDPIGTSSPNDQGVSVDDTTNTFSFSSGGKNKSLLYPAHFSKIMWGNCQSKVKKYNKCSSYSMSLVDFKCEDKPKYCEDEEEWLLSDK